MLPCHENNHETPYNSSLHLKKSFMKRRWNYLRLKNAKSTEYEDTSNASKMNLFEL